MIRRYEDISMYCAKLLYWQSYLLCYFVGLHRILYRAIEEVDLPDSIVGYFKIYTYIFYVPARRASDGHITFNKTPNLDSLQELPGQEV